MKIKNILLFTALAQLVAMSSCTKNDDTDTQTLVVEETEEVPIIDIDVVHTKEVPQTMQYTANVEAFNSNNISPASMNRIKTINGGHGVGVYIYSPHKIMLTRINGYHVFPECRTLKIVRLGAREIVDGSVRDTISFKY